jgi:hypothetical protein
VVVGTGMLRILTVEKELKIDRELSPPEPFAINCGPVIHLWPDLVG